MGVPKTIQNQNMNQNQIIPVTSDEPPSQFPYRKNITYTLQIPDQDCIDYSIGGFIIGEKGFKIKNFVNPINQQNPTRTKQFFRIRALGKLNHIKSKNESFKR